MLGSLMQHNDIDGVIVGADRIVKNGDTANKVSSCPILPLPLLVDRN
jgi:methylthioribose-1-phosphate isomerase